jgi:predicted transposase YdaD
MSDVSRDQPPRTIHDAMFKRIFSDPRHAAAELRAVLPPRIARHIEWATLEAGHANLVGTRFKQHHGDLIFRARLFDGHDAVIWLLFEHQSTVDAWMPLRVTELSLVFWKRWRERDSTARRLPAIIPVVVYHGPAPWSAATSLSQLMNVSDEASRDLEGLGVSCRFVLDDLSAASDEAISGREMEAYPKLGLVVFKYGPDMKLPEHLARYSTDIRALLATEHGIEQWGVLVDYTWHVNPHLDRDEFIHRFAPLVGQEAKSTMMTLADRLRLEGHNEGHNEGHKQGQKDALSALLLQLLARRFGPLPAEAEKRVAQAEATELQRWGLRLLDAASLDEVFAPAGQ